MEPDPVVRCDPAGAPPLDWWHEVDAVLDGCLDKMAGKFNGGSPRPRHVGEASAGRSGGGDTDQPDKIRDWGQATVGARGVHLRRALEDAGILQTLDALDVTARGYRGAHYAVWPPELCRRLIEEMCPRRVCRVCREPSRRITERPEALGKTSSVGSASGGLSRLPKSQVGYRVPDHASRVTLGWSDCACPGTPGLSLDGFHTGPRWRPGLVLDPFVGSGTTLAVAASLSRDAIGIDFDSRNLALARKRCGPTLAFGFGQPTGEAVS